MSGTRPRHPERGDSPRDVRLRDPGALRALAHPARLAVVEELYQGLERTATDLAELTGLTPSAMSYHLRALQRWGIVERADTRGDGRERPWRAPGRSLSLVSDLSASATEAKDVILGVTLQQLREEFHRWSLVEAHESDAWREVAGLQKSVLWLTGAEAQRLSAEVSAVLRRQGVEDRDAVRHPKGARRVVWVHAVVPSVDEPAEP